MKLCVSYRWEPDTITTWRQHLISELWANEAYPEVQDVTEAWLRGAPPIQLPRPSRKVYCAPRGRR